MLDLDAPWDRLQALPNALWLPAAITSAGTSARRLADLAHWCAALEAGGLPDESLAFADPQAVLPMRAVVAELQLAGLCLGTPALVQQVLRTMLWHLDRINDHLPALRRSEAIALEARGFRAEWELQKSGWEEVLSLKLGLGELANLSWDQLRGLLRSREWREAQRISALRHCLRTCSRWPT
jgi:hypothetical protein